mmetsp:Transcript_1989/g.4448  ORF Transcript_1989/g.4448 Transcript_1989/m.4448 type:complete len:130 (+) Transcript_1989:4997-5386(+)
MLSAARWGVRAFSSSIKIHKPSQKLEFDNHGLMLIYQTPSASTFLKVYAPINIGFIGLHLYLMVDEIMRPVVPGMYGYLAMSTCLSAIGMGVAYSVEMFARRYIKTIYLKNNGQALLINFHSAYTVSSS